jgi:hypothetical protein
MFSLGSAASRPMMATHTYPISPRTFSQYLHRTDVSWLRACERLLLPVGFFYNLAENFFIASIEFIYLTRPNPALYSDLIFLSTNISFLISGAIAANLWASRRVLGGVANICCSAAILFLLAARDMPAMAAIPRPRPAPMLPAEYGLSLMN